MDDCATQLNVAIVEVTNRCNLRCPHCASASGVARPDELTLAEMKSVVRDLAALGCRVFTILGGEFLLRPDWFEIGQEVRSAGMQLNFITNGLLVTPEVRRKMRELDPGVLAVSFDGATPESYKAARGVDGYAKCRRLLDDLVSDGFRQVSAITTFSSRNLADYDIFEKTFVDTEIVWQVQLVHRAGERFDDSLLLSDEQYAWYVDKVTTSLNRLLGRLRLRVMDDFGYFPLTPKLRFLCEDWDGCPAGRHVIGIRANGDVLPCLSLGSEFIEGNLRRRPLQELWRDPDVFARFRRKSTELEGRCGKCPMARQCKAGCSAAAISTTGSLKENRFCVRRLETERIVRQMTGML